MRYYKLDDNGEPVEADDALDWARWFEETDLRQVAQDRDEGPHGEDIRVSTVFLGVDHNFGLTGPPVLWETMVFGGLLDGETERYTSRAAALAGHQRVCQKVKAAQDRAGRG